MERLLVKKYELNLNIDKNFLFIKYKRKLLLKFEQAKLIDTIEFMKIMNEGEYGLIIWLIQFIKQHSDKKITMRTRKYIMQNREVIFKQIKETFFEGCFSGGDKKEEESPISGYITILSEKLNIDPIRLVKEYTPKQLEFFTEGLVWNTQEQSVEGQKKNKLRLKKIKAQNRPDDEKEKIKDILDSMKVNNGSGTN